MTDDAVQTPSADTQHALRRLREQSPKLYRKLLKAARQARGLVPVTSERGDDKRALRAITHAVTGRTSARQQKKTQRGLRRAFRAELHASNAA